MRAKLAIFFSYFNTCILRRSVCRNAADNDSGVGPACSASRPDSCNGAALVGGPDTTDMDMLSKMSHNQLEAQMSKLGSVSERFR